MITVFKYELGNVSEIELPIDAEILTVAFQNRNLCMWAKIDTEVKMEIRNFKVFGTGHEIPRDMGLDYEFIGTAHMSNGLVFHIFERLGL